MEMMSAWRDWRKELKPWWQECPMSSWAMIFRRRWGTTVCYNFATTAVMERVKAVVAGVPNVDLGNDI